VLVRRNDHAWRIECKLRRNDAGRHLTARFDFRAEIGLSELIGEMQGFLSGRRARSLLSLKRPDIPVAPEQKSAAPS
jgi:hypothetical protein